MWICFGEHLAIFALLLASYICPGFIKCLGRATSLFYFVLVGGMVVTQVIFFHGSECNRVAPLLYYWIFINILCFYVLIAYGLSLWGAYICWEVDEEEKLIAEARARFVTNAMASGADMDKLRLAGWTPEQIMQQTQMVALAQT